jgi:hypothetical protein
MSWYYFSIFAGNEIITDESRERRQQLIASINSKVDTLIKICVDDTQKIALVAFWAYFEERATESPDALVEYRSKYLNQLLESIINKTDTLRDILKDKTITQYRGKWSQRFYDHLIALREAFVSNNEIYEDPVQLSI